MARLIPFLRSEDAKTQAAFYTQALGGDIQSVTTGAEVPNVDPSMKETVFGELTDKYSIHWTISTEA